MPGLGRSAAGMETRTTASPFLLTFFCLSLAGLACQTVTGLLATATPVPSPTPLPTDTPIPIPTAVPEEYQLPDEGAFHIEQGETAQYGHYPPSSGLHYGQILNWGFYNEEVPPEYWVHSLEHGGIVILYNCVSDCGQVEAALEDFLLSAPPEDVFNEVKILISPNSQIEHPVIALAWTWELDLNTPDPELLMAFYQRHVNQGPELAP